MTNGVLREVARAKVNLSLKILGRRSDGYHELASLVAFADIGDVVEVDPSSPDRVVVEGPFASGLSGDNIVETAIDRLRGAHPEIVLGGVRIEKHLPIAAGLGGGSANAAAFLRVIQRLNPGLLDVIDWQGLALSLGADVPVCLANETRWMTGIGERLESLGVYEAFSLSVVLANPIAPVPRDKTAEVFRVLNAAPLGDLQPVSVPTNLLSDMQSVVGFATQAGNDLQAAAAQVVPEIGDVLAALDATHGCRLAAMSGAGPTCFGIYSADDAKVAAKALEASHPTWWVCPTLLRI
ncbi:MAG: 4-(cytidine 5'-diphospho)-2-C-methyl-D-erythritol kinase [Pseudomonadota bacterium]